MNKIEELYKEETLQELKEINKSLSDSGAALLVKNIKMVKGDRGDDGVSLSNISHVIEDDSVIVKVDRTDGKTYSFSLPIVKGGDGKDGQDGINGESSTIEIGEVVEGESAKVVNRGSATEVKLDFVIPKAKDGRDGLQGKAGRSGKDGKGINWRGTWNVTVSYAVNDAVEYQGSSYICVQEGAGKFPTDRNYWNLIAQRGNNGATGVSSGGSGSAGLIRSVIVTSGNVTGGSTALNDYVYIVPGAHTVTLPTAVGNNNLYTVKNTHTADITVNTTSSQTIDGSTTITLTPLSSVNLISNNANWSII